MELTFILSFGLTLLVFSYLLGDNILFRLTLSVFVGLAAAFTSIVTVQTVLLPLLSTAGKTTGQFQADVIVFGLAALLTGLLLAKPFVQLKSITNLALAVLVAIGAAVAVAGALTGTLIPLTLDTARLRGTDALGLLNTAVLVIGVLSSLAYFQYRARRTDEGTVKRGRINRVFAVIGEGFIAVTLGAFYGAAILTSLTILAGHMALLFSL